MLHCPCYRYKEDVSSEQKDALMELCRVHVHSQVITVLREDSFVFLEPLLNRIRHFLICMPRSTIWSRGAMLSDFVGLVRMYVCTYAPSNHAAILTRARANKYPNFPFHVPSYFGNCKPCRVLCTRRYIASQYTCILSFREVLED